MRAIGWLCMWMMIPLVPLGCGSSTAGRDGASDVGVDVPVGSDVAESTDGPEILDAASDAADASAPHLALSGDPVTGVLGVTSDAFAVTVHNDGESATGSLLLGLSGSEAVDFQIVSNGCLGELAPGQSCRLGMTFKGSVVGPRTALLTVTDGSVIARLGISALCKPRSLKVTGDASLGTAELGKTSAPAVFTFTNDTAIASGTLAVAIDSAEFVVARNLCDGRDLAPDQSCTVAVQFRPTSLGDKKATLRITSSSTLTEVPLTGTSVPGWEPCLILTPATWDFGSVATHASSPEKVFTVSFVCLNTTEPLSVTLTGAGASSFTWTTTCGVPLKVGQTCAVSVAFSPSLPYPVAANLTVTDGTPGTASAALSGTGVGPSAVKLSPTQVPALTDYCDDFDGVSIGCYSPGPAGKASFADTKVGQKSAPLTFTLQAGNGRDFTETGDLVAAFAGDAAADFAVGINTCVQSLLPGQRCTVEIIFAPRASGLRFANLTMTGALAAHATVNFSAIGLP